MCKYGYQVSLLYALRWVIKFYSLRSFYALDCTNFVVSFKQICKEIHCSTTQLHNTIRLRAKPTYSTVYNMHSEYVCTVYIHVHIYTCTVNSHYSVYTCTVNIHVHVQCICTFVYVYTVHNRSDELTVDGGSHLSESGCYCNQTDAILSMWSRDALLI